MHGGIAPPLRQEHYLSTVIYIPHAPVACTSRTPCATLSSEPKEQTDCAKNQNADDPPIDSLYIHAMQHSSLGLAANPKQRIYQCDFALYSQVYTWHANDDDDVFSFLLKTVVATQRHAISGISLPRTPTTRNARDIATRGVGKKTVLTPTAPRDIATNTTITLALSTILRAASAPSSRVRVG